ncbi:MAG: serine hydrolase [Syntrophus sp. (in: bacteria)]|nr:serine hydrolase [Syntrophus sp. (in: bacteria)]
MKICTRDSFTLAIFIAISFFLLNGCSTTPPRFATVSCADYECVKESISQLARKEMEKNKVTGLSVALVDDKGLIWAQGFGYADKENKIPATPQTVYRVASISKLFTATAIMQLAEQGKINIDESLTTYLPEFSIKTRFPGEGRITPRNLMTHHSGLPANLYKGIFSSKPEPFTKVIKEIKDEYLAYPPESVYSYSNLGVTLLGGVIERVSGKSYASYMDESILGPIGMDNSSFSTKTGMVVAKGYKDGDVTNELSIRDLPATGLLSSAVDLGRFMQMVLTGGISGEHQIIKRETLAEMLRPQNIKVPLDMGIYIGLGWALDGMGNTEIKNAGPVAHHGGSLPSFNSQLLVLPEQKLGVVVLTNSSTRPAVDNVAIEALILALEVKTGIKQPRWVRPQKSPKSLSPEEVSLYTGHYATPIGLIKAYEKSDFLKAEIFGNTVSLIPRADGMLAMKYKLFGLIPISLRELDDVGVSRVVVAGREFLLARSQGLDMVFGEKISPPSVPEKWLDRIGAYEIVNAGNDVLFFDGVRIGRQDGFLLIEYYTPLLAEGSVKLPIAPVSDTEAIILGLGSGMGETIRAITIDGKECLQYSGYQLRKISTQ